MGTVCIFLHQAQRTAVCLGRKHGTGGKINTQSNDLLRRYAALPDYLRHCLFQHLQIVRRVLERPIRPQPLPVRQRPIHHAMGIFPYAGSHFPGRPQLHQHGAARLGTKVDSHRIRLLLIHCLLPSSTKSCIDSVFYLYILPHFSPLEHVRIIRNPFG